MNIKTGIMYKNKYHFILRNSDESIAEERITDNVVKNWAFDTLQSFSTPIATHTHFGQGQPASGIEPSLTGNSLYSSRGILQNTITGYDYSGEWKTITRYVRVPAGTLTGIITEVGLGGQYNNTVITHSMLKDSTGTQLMPIQKDALQILDVYITVNVKVIVSGDLIPIYSQLLYGNPIGTPVRQGDTSPYWLEMMALFHLVGGSIAINITGLKNIPGAVAPSDQINVYTLNKMMSVASTSGTKPKRFYAKWTDTQGNGTVPSIIKSVELCNYVPTTSGGHATSFGYLSLPNEKYFTKILLGFPLKGDGVTTDFKLPLSEMNTTPNLTIIEMRGDPPQPYTDTTRVEVDGVILDPSDYVFFGKNYDYIQAWESIDLDGLVPNTGLVQNRTAPTAVSPLVARVSAGLDSPLMFYYPDGLELSTLRGQVTSTTYAWYLECYDGIETDIEAIKSDNANWTRKATINTTTDTQRHFTPIIKNYWRISTNIPNTITSQNWFMFGNPIEEVNGEFKQKPTIRFKTPPAENAIIKVIACSDYPIKYGDVNHPVGASIFGVNGIDMTVDRL